MPDRTHHVPLRKLSEADLRESLWRRRKRRGARKKTREKKARAVFYERMKPFERAKYV